MHTVHSIDGQNEGLQHEKARLYQSFTLRSIAINARASEVLPVFEF